MKVGRHYIGVRVTVKWHDPMQENYKVAEAPVGLKALAVWEEEGVIDDITEGVVRVRHSVGYNPPNHDVPDEALYTYIVDDLIDEIIEYEPKNAASA